jgi:phosphate transport system substrate-binding protein
VKQSIICKILFFCLSFAALCVHGAENISLRIADATRSGDQSIKESALLYALGSSVNISVSRCSSKEAIKGVSEGNFEIAIVSIADITPENSAAFDYFFYAAEAALCIIHPQNPIKNISRQELRSIYLSERPAWRKINGDNSDIHRYSLSHRANDSGLAEYLLGVSEFAKGIARLNSNNENQLMVAADQAGIALIGFVPDKAANLRFLSVDGVTPDTKNIYSGKYPLSLRYVMLTKKDSDSEVLKNFIKYVKTQEFADRLLDNGKIPPLVTK